jgi:RNA polymerase sigma-70 factor (ECF subfamily)
MGEMTMASDNQRLPQVAEPAGPNNGSAAAQALLWSDMFDTYVDALYTFVRTRVPPDSVDDIVQEVFTAAVISTNRSSSLPDSTWHWLLAIARSKIVDHFRRSGRQSQLMDVLGRLGSQRERVRQAVLDESALPEDLCQQAELKALVQAALGELEPGQRDCLHAKYYEGLTLEGVAARMRISRAAANSLLHRARQDLRQGLLAMLADPTEIEEYRP